MLRLVPTVQTKISNSELIKSFIEAWKNIYGVFPSKTSIAILSAQIELETGSQNYLWNYNLGNIKAYDIAGQTIDYCVLKGVYEFINGQRVEIPPTNPGSWFRAFNSLTEGTTFYFNFLKNGRYKLAWNAAERGDLSDFVHQLHSAGYYTASEAQYLSGAKSYYNKFMASTDFETAMAQLNQPIPPPQPPINNSIPDNTSSNIPLPTPDPVPDNTQIQPIKLTGFQSFQKFLFDFLNSFPWIKVINWLGSMLVKKN